MQRISLPESKAVAKQKITMFIRRMNDFLLAPDSTKSLLKDGSRFAEVKMERHGGSKAVKCCVKKSSKSETQKKYFVALHAVTEYFANEILQLLGIETPKTRLIKTDGFFKYRVVTRAIENYIPLWSLWHEDPSDANKNEFKIDFRQQIITDTSGRQYKISGNLFAAHTAATILGDWDFLRDNIGVVRVANRFYTVAIDKDKANFNVENYYQRRTTTSMLEDQPLFQATTKDQVISLLYRLKQAIEKPDLCPSEIEKIFMSPRVNATEPLKEHCKNWFENFKQTAISLMEGYEEVYGKDYLEQFAQREKIRITIANKVIGKFDLDNSEELKKLIVEDLRAVYYCEDFAKNKEISLSDIENQTLQNRLLRDVATEFELNVPAELRCSGNII